MPARPPHSAPDTYARVFAALAHPARRHILINLNLSGGELKAGDIARLFAHAWPTTTRHLQALEAAGLVGRRRHGRTQVYRINRNPIDLAAGWLASFAAPMPGPKPRSKSWRSRKKP